MIIRQLFDSESSTYTYLIGDADSQKAVLIDPVLEKTDTYIQLLSQLELSLDYAIDTHTHADHITALGELRKVTGCVTMMGEQSEADCLSDKFRDGDVITIGKTSLEVIYTPGHTDDSYSFYLSHGEQHFLFTGDTLLIRGSGRTDFQNGDAHAQHHSIFQKLLSYPDSTFVYPGHDYKGWTMSTVLEERRYNPRLQVESVSEYAELMGSLGLDDPKLMDIAVPANKACGGIND